MLNKNKNNEPIEDENDENLQNTNQTASVINAPDGNTNGDASVAGNTNGDASVAGNTAQNDPVAYKEIIEQQKSTIDTLLNRTDQLTKQINMLLQSGVQITDNGQANAADDSASLTDDYIPLADLGAEFGKR